MALLPLNQPTLFDEFVAGIQNRERQISDFFAGATELFQKKVADMQMQGFVFGETISDLTDRINVAEVQLSENENDHKTKMKEAEEKLAALCARLDNLRGPMDQSAEQIKKLKHADQELRAQLEMAKQENASQASRLAEFKKVHEGENVALQEQYKATVQRQKTFDAQNAQLLGQVIELKKHEVATRVKLDAITGRFNGHAHTVNYRSLGKWNSSGTSGPNK